MSEKKVAIVDYNLGNLFSVIQSCEKVGINAELCFSGEELHKYDAIILPGVGAFGEAMQNMYDLGLVEPLRKLAAEGCPIFGICLGLQLLFTESEEFGTMEGLGLIPGTIKKFKTEVGGVRYKVPQICWNEIEETSGLQWADSPLCDLENKQFMYFVHSYYASPEDTKYMLTETTYGGIRYTSAVFSQPNVFATQFHPEKSGEAGLSIYRNWAAQNKLI
tara:strand:+ start:460 stop:1116 length:657 start_codon:yes stop_codon:yes gene_type:complete